MGSQCSAAAAPEEAVAKDGRPLRDLTAAEIASTPACSLTCCATDKLNFFVIGLAVVIGVYVVVNLAQTAGKHHGHS